MANGKQEDNHGKRSLGWVKTAAREACWRQVKMNKKEKISGGLKRK